MLGQLQSIEEIQANYIKRQAQEEAERAQRPAQRSYLVGNLGIITFSPTYSSAHLDLTDEYSARQAQTWNEDLFDPKQKWISENHFADGMDPTGFGDFTVDLTLSLNETKISKDYVECITFFTDLAKDGNGSYGYFLFTECHQQGEDVKLDNLKMPGKEAIVRLCKELYHTYRPENDTTDIFYMMDRQEKAIIQITSQINQRPDNPYEWLKEIAEKLTSYL